MAQSAQSGRFGHIVRPDDAWLAKQEQEPILEPELPIVDTHHHLWQRGADWPYFLPELLADLNTGHNIVATVFEECRSMYRAEGPEEMRPVGEVEFVAGIAAMSASGNYGPTKIAQGIVAYADLALGDRVEPVLEALIRAGGGRVKGVRYSVGYDADSTIGNSRPDSAPHIYARPEVRAGVAKLATHGLVLDAWCYHPQLQDVVDLARTLPQAEICMCHVGGVLGYGAYAGKKDEVHAAWRASMTELAKCPNVSVKIGGMLNRGAALDFRGSIGEDRIFDYIHQVAWDSANQLVSMWGTSLLVPNKSMNSALVVVKLPSQDGSVIGRVVAALLQDYNTYIQTFGYANGWYVRVSGQIYLEVADYVLMGNRFLALMKTAEAELGVRHL